MVDMRSLVEEGGDKNYSGFQNQQQNIPQQQHGAFNQQQFNQPQQQQGGFNHPQSGFNQQQGGFNQQQGGFNQQQGGFNQQHQGGFNQQQQFNQNQPTGFANPPGGGGGSHRYSKRDVIDSLCTSFNQDLLVSKTFYFFFFSAFGSLFPLLAVYFKQLGMSATQSGMLIGFRPFVEFLSAPLWGSLADRYRKGKIMLICSLFSWIVFTMSLAFVQPLASSCVVYNETHHVLYGPNSDRMKRSVIEATPLKPDQYDQDQVQEFNFTDEKWPDFVDLEDPKPKSIPPKPKRDERRKLPSSYVVGKSPNSVEYTLNYNSDEHTTYVSPPFSSMVYKWEDVQEVFFLLLLLVLLGEFFSAPAITLADSVTLTYLGDNMDNYGKQRMFGSLGWGLAMFFVGIALDHSTSFPDHPCGPHMQERNYTICFATFSVLMGCALIASTQFRFDYDLGDDGIPMKHVENGPQIQTTAPTQAPNSGIMTSYDGQQHGTVTATLGVHTTEVPEQAPKSQVFAQTTRKLPEWFSVIKTFATVRYGAFLYVTWFMGFGIGLVFTFLFWHLQDLGGTPTLFGVASVVNHISEIFAYFFSFKFIKQIGHVKVLCIGLAGNICRFLYISWLKDPWWVLPFEFIQGITHAAVWAACCSYITQATPSNLRSSAQGVLQGLHHGLGRGCGAIIGGIFVSNFGTQVTFRGYGFACLIVLIAFIFINFYRKDKGFSSFHDEQEPDMVVEETSHLAPHGVPANPMAKSLSRQNLSQHKEAQDEYGQGNGYGTLGGQGQQAYQSEGGHLGVPQGGGGYYTGGGNNLSDFNMNTTKGIGGNTQITRGALAAAFNPKGLLAAASSPDSAFEYNLIKRDFKAYDDVTNSNHLEDAEETIRRKHHEKIHQERVLTAPQPKTSIFAPQPSKRNDVTQYEW